MSNAIFQAITNAMADISPIAKAKKNQQQGFQYRGIDDVMNELSPILTKHHIFIYPEVISKERSERQTKSGGALIYSILTIKYHFATDDGSEVCTTVVGEGMDSGDKASNKAMAVAFKYACLQMFCIPTIDMEDPDRTTPPELKSTPKQENTPPPKKPQGETVSPAARQEIITSIGEIMTAVTPDNQPIFTEAEKAQERATVKGAANAEALKSQHSRLKAEMEKRKAAFNDEIPFEDDLPFDKPKETVPIHQDEIF